MPTRTEVQQAIRARDVIQVDDAALILDYIDTVAGSTDAPGRAVVLDNWTSYDEIHDRDFRRIYEYLAVLGTAPGTLNSWLRCIKFRDILARRLLSDLFDKVDAAWMMPFTGAAYWFQTDELSTMWQDEAGTMPVVTIDVDRALRIDNMGSAGGFLSKSSGGPRYSSSIGTATGVTGALQFEPNGQEHLGAVIADDTFASGDWGFFWVADRVNQAGGAEYVMGWDSVNGRMSVAQVASNRMQAEVAAESFSPTETISDATVMAGYGTTDGSSIRTAGFNVRASEFSTASGSFAGPAGGSILDLGGDDNDNNNTFHGRIFEVVIAKNTHALRAAWETYTTNRYGVIWV